MNNKILVELSIPIIDETFDVFFPLNKKIGNVITLLNRSLKEITNEAFVPSENNFLYNRNTGEKYDINVIVKKTNIKNGTRLILY